MIWGGLTVKKSSLLLIGLIVFVIIFASGCPNTSSTNVKTSGIYANFEVASDQQIIAKAVLTVGGPGGTYLNLQSGESLSCNGVPMTRRSNIFSQIWYDATISANATYLFRFHRTDGDVDTTFGPLPGEPTITSAAPDITLGDDLPISWNTGAGGTASVDIQVTSPAISSINTSSADNGSFTVVGSLFTQSPTAEPGPYALNIKITRTKNFTLSSPYQGVSAKTKKSASQTGTITIP
jgi:hypothetical protein